MRSEVMTRADFSRRRCLALLGAGAAWSTGPRGAFATHVFDGAVAPATLPDDDASDRAFANALGPLPLVFAVHVSVPARDIAEFARCAASIPGGIAYGSTGIGSSLHVAGERLLERRLQLRTAHVAYRSLEALTHDLASGHIHASFGVAAAFAPYARGWLRILGSGGAARLAALPHVKTFAEQGFDDEALEARVRLARWAPRPSRLPASDQLQGE
jgi:tripartite-type tricarboxylate transporter receptor subunit TctC